MVRRKHSSISLCENEGNTPRRIGQDFRPRLPVSRRATERPQAVARIAAEEGDDRSANQKVSNRDRLCRDTAALVSGVILCGLLLRGRPAVGKTEVLGRLVARHISGIRRVAPMVQSWLDWHCRRFFPLAATDSKNAEVLQYSMEPTLGTRSKETVN